MEREIANFPAIGNSNGDAAATNLTCKQMHDYKYGGLNKGGIVNLTLDRASSWTRKARENSKKIARESKTVQDCLKKTLDPLEKKHDFLVTKSDSTTEVDIDKYFQKSKAFFIPFDAITQYFGVPGIDGIRIYKGIDEDDNEMLVLVAATNIGDSSYDIFDYCYTINKKAGNEIDVDPPAPVTGVSPCPPPSPCPHFNKLNSSITP